MHPTLRHSPLRATVALALLLSACATQSTGGGTGPATTAAPTAVYPPPIDPQRVQDQDDMTWNDFRPIPGTDWANPAKHGSDRTMRVAILAGDWSDFTFVITKPKGSDPFGNPKVDPVTRDQVPKFYADFYGVPNATNKGHTVHEYWMEQSHGRIGVTVDAFGPYRLSGSYTRKGGSGELDSLWRAAVGDSVARSFNLVVRMYAGYDETATWRNSAR